jgi:hypothetical protein
MWIVNRVENVPQMIEKTLPTNVLDMVQGIDADTASLAVMAV